MRASHTAALVGNPWSVALRAPGRTRTHDPLLRRQLLYPPELRRPARRSTLLAATPPSAAARYELAGAPGRSDRLSIPLVAVAQVVRASGCGPEGRGFESPRSPQVRALSLYALTPPAGSRATMAPQNCARDFELATSNRTRSTSRHRRSPASTAPSLCATPPAPEPPSTSLDALGDVLDGYHLLHATRARALRALQAAVPGSPRR